MGYSPISSIHIKNFRNLGDVKIDFKDSPIISLIGENEAGKTSVVKAIGVCCLNATPREHKDFIRDGTSGFGVEITLEDGTVVTRIKTSSINRYSVTKPDGTNWEASKLEGLPLEVQKVMGMTEEPETKEFLHIRTYENQLLFVVTPASTNYKVMYDALKVGQITSAIKTGSSEANSLKAVISRNESGIEALTKTLSTIHVHDLTNLLNVRNAIKDRMTHIDKMEKVINAIENAESAKKRLGALAELENVARINESLAMNIESIGRLLDRNERLIESSKPYEQLESIGNIDLSTFNKVASVLDYQKAIDTKVDQSGALAEVVNAPEISTTLALNLDQVSKLMEQHEHNQRVLSIIDKASELTEISTAVFNIEALSNRVKSMVEYNEQAQNSINSMDAYIEQVLTWMKSIGVATATCPRCGEDVEMDISSY